MSLTISSNLTASIANRSLQISNAAMERSLSKLSSGSRVESARDDAASMAIGSRIKAELAGLRTYQQNATQATTMLQMADGAYARGQDMLIRMKALATQAQSGNLSNVERGMLDTEFQQIKSEIGRLASSTQFSGQTLVASVNTPSYGLSNFLNASTTQGGTQANTASAGGTSGISDDGQWVTFTSTATNLDSAADGSAQLYLKNLFTGEVRMISKNAAGALADGLVSIARISGDGRTVYFTSAATNLAGTGADGSTLNLYKYDVTTGATTQIMPTVNSAQPFADITGIRTTTDGRYVSFITSAANIVAGDTNGTVDVFVYDSATQTTIRASMSSTGQQTSAGGGIFTAEVSSDGRFVTYTSASSDTVSNDTNGVSDVFIFDRQTGTSTLVSRATTGNSGNAAVTSSRMSGNGRYLFFTTAATDLIAGGSNGQIHTYAYDRLNGLITLESRDNSGNQGNGASSIQAVSVDGRYMLYNSTATNLVTGDTNGTLDLFIRDRQTGQTFRIVGQSGTQLNAAVSAGASMSGDGRNVMFISGATNVVVTDTNGFADMFALKVDNGVFSYDQSVRVSNSASTSANVQMQLGSMRLEELEWGLSQANITTQTNADYAFSTISKALDSLNTYRVRAGAAINRLEKVIDISATMIENQDNARSAYMDLDVASEMSIFTAKQIAVQAGISMLTQSRTTQQAMLRLIESEGGVF